MFGVAPVRGGNMKYVEIKQIAPPKVNYPPRKDVGYRFKKKDKL